MTTTADHTIVAVFQDSITAQSAADQLRSAGITSDRIFVSSQGSAPGASYSESAASGTHHEGGIVGWFKSLFSDEETGDRTRYESAVAGGRTIVSVGTQASDVDRVSDILDRYSPIDIHNEESMAHGVATFNTGNAGYQGSRSDFLNAQDELSGTAGVTGMAAENRAIQSDVQRGGLRVYPRTAERPMTAGLASYAGDDDFRTHFDSTHGASGAKYDDYAPAYRYGSEIANDPRYKGRKFADVQSDLQRDYTTRNPNSAWEKVKDSVQYGWDKIIGESSSAASSR